MSNLNYSENSKGGGCCETRPDLALVDVDDLVFELHRLRASNGYLLRELSRLQAEIQRVYCESIY